MTTKPFSSEDQYIWQEEQQRRLQKLAKQQQAAAEPEKRHLKELHWMHCPKCGQALATEHCGPVEIDVCPGCRGLWLDANEMETITSEVIAVAEGRWKVGGGVSLSVLAQKLGVSMRADTPGVVLSDWLSRQLQKELVSGDTWQSDGLTFTVLQIRRRRSHRVLVEASGGCSRPVLNQDLSYVR